MKEIFVAVDASDKSLEAADYALSIASRERTELIILNILERSPGFMENQGMFGPSRRTDKGLLPRDTGKRKDIGQNKGES